MAERPRLEAVLFDAGGTLVRLDFEWMSEALATLGARVTPGELRRAEVEGRRRYDRSTEARAGDATGLEPPLGHAGDVREYFGGMLEAAGLPDAVVAAALDRFQLRQRETGLWTRPMEGARGALDALAALGVRRAVVSNSDGRAATHLRDCDMLAAVEFVVDSHEVGVEKPDPRIFRIALERLGVPPERTLYVGDIRSVDEVGARAAGLHFVLLDPFGDYSAGGVPSIAGIDRLASFVSQRFQVVVGERPGTHTGGDSWRPHRE